MITPGSLVRICHACWWVLALENHGLTPGARIAWAKPSDCAPIERWAPLPACVEILPRTICRRPGCTCKLFHPWIYGLADDVLSGLPADRHPVQGVDKQPADQLGAVHPLNTGALVKGLDAGNG